MNWYKTSQENLRFFHGTDSPPFDQFKVFLPSEKNASASGLVKQASTFWGREGSGVLIVCPEDKTALLVLRSREVEQPGTWGIPGGAVKKENDVGQEDNENFFDEDEIDPAEHVTKDVSFASAMVETEEEIGVTPSNYQLLKQTVYNSGNFKYVTYILTVDLKEKARISQNIHLNWENSKAQWFPLSSLPAGLHFGLEFVVKNAPELFPRKRNVRSASVDKQLILVRGLPGSGKSSLAKHLAGKSGEVFSTDDFFMVDGKYVFDPEKLHCNHMRNQNMVKISMEYGVSPIVVDNTNVTAKEMEPYLELAKRYGYRVSVQEPDTPWKNDPVELAKRNQHGVPQEIIEEMLHRWETFEPSEEMVKGQEK